MSEIIVFVIIVFVLLVIAIALQAYLIDRKAGESLRLLESRLESAEEFAESVQQREWMYRRTVSHEKNIKERLDVIEKRLLI